MNWKNLLIQSDDTKCYAMLIMFSVNGMNIRSRFKWNYLILR